MGRDNAEFGMDEGKTTAETDTHWLHSLQLYNKISNLRVKEIPEFQCYT